VRLRDAIFARAIWSFAGWAVRAGVGLVLGLLALLAAVL
jgi:hypothetical protein